MNNFDDFKKENKEEHNPNKILIIGGPGSVKKKIHYLIL